MATQRKNGQICPRFLLRFVDSDQKLSEQCPYVYVKRGVITYIYIRLMMVCYAEWLVMMVNSG